MANPPPALVARLRALLARYHELTTRLADPHVLSDRERYRELTKALAALKPAAQRADRFEALLRQRRETEELLRSAGKDAAMARLAEAELATLSAQIDALQQELESLVISEGEAGSARSLIMEIRAGTGGQEASLFAADLYRMYRRYAERQGLKVELMAHAPTESGGLKEVSFSIEGPKAYRQLRFEAGVHRVQRVPATEAQGRIHTSTVTVAVLPEPEEVEVRIAPEELRVDVFRSSGPGGQSVNTTDSAVRVTHLPTNLVVTCQDERSQLRNKEKALRILRARLVDLEQERHERARARERKQQIGRGDRSEKIRTYNFPDRRVTDHRIGLTLHRLDSILEGELDELLDALAEADRQQRLQAAA